MKKILAAVLFVLAVAVGAGVYMCIYYVDITKFGEELIPYTDVTHPEYTITAEHKEEVTNVLRNNKTRVYQVLTWGKMDRKKLLFPKKYEYDVLVLTFGEDYEIKVYQASLEDDSVYIEYQNLKSKKKKYYTVAGYRTFDQLLEAVSVKGYQGMNELIKNTD